MFTKRQIEAMFRASDRPTSDGASEFEAMAGDAFKVAIKRGVVPPPGWMFTNRFLNGSPCFWAEELCEQIPQDTDAAGLVDSLKLLVELLQRFERDGASLPEWLAAEEAITLNLTALLMALANQVADQHQTVMVEKWGSGELAEMAWIPGMDTGRWLLCEKIREKAKGAEVGARFGQQWRAATEEHPSEMLRGVEGAIWLAVKEVEATFEDAAIPTGGPEAAVDDAIAEDWDDDAEPPDRFGRLMPTMRHHALVVRCAAFAKSVDEREAVVARAGHATDDLVQAQVRQLLENATRRFPAQLAGKETGLGTALYTIALGGWNVGFAAAENDGWSRSQAPNVSALADAAHAAFGQLDIAGLADPVWYALDNLRGLWARGQLANGIALDFADVTNEPWAQELVQVADWALLWGFCLGQTERTL